MKNRFHCQALMLIDLCIRYAYVCCLPLTVCAFCSAKQSFIYSFRSIPAGGIINQTAFAFAFAFTQAKIYCSICKMHIDNNT